MDVNVELLSTEKSNLYKVIRIIYLTAIILFSLVLILFTLLDEKQKVSFSAYLFYASSILITSLVISNLILWVYAGGIKTLGKITFSDNELTISTSDSRVSYAVKTLEKPEIRLSGYSGQPNLPTGLINPSKRGIENFIIFNDKKLRFKLISKNHRDRLIDKIEDWEKSNRNILLKLNY